MNSKFRKHIGYRSLPFYYMIKVVFAALLFITIPNCSNIDNKFLNRELQLPEELAIIENNELVNVSDTLQVSDSKKIIFFLNGNCLKCLGQLQLLQEIIDNTPGDYEIWIMVFTSQINNFITNIYPKIEIKAKFFYNENNLIERENNLTGFYKYGNTIILDNNNKIISYGDPVANTWYQSEIINTLSL